MATLASLMVSLGLRDNSAPGVQSATRNLERLQQQVSRVDQGLSSFADRSARSLARTAVALTSVHSGAAALSGLASVASTAAGALGVLPAAGVAVGAGMAAARVGVSGFGEAMENLGDPEAFAEAVAELSPAAQESARAVQGLTDEWESLTDSVQDALFADLADDITALGGTYLPIVEDGLTGIAASYNSAAAEAASWLGQSAQVSTVGTMFGDVGSAIGEASAAAQPLLSILLDVAAVGGEFLPGMAGGFADAAQRAAEFVSNARETGQLHDWIATGLDTLEQLGDLLGNVGSIAGSVFGALDASGGGFLSTLVALTGRVAEFLKTVQGQAALQALGTALGTVAAVVSDVLLVALQQLAPILVQLAPAFAALVAQAGGLLIPALQMLGPLVLQLATFLAQNVTWLGPLALGLIGAAQAFGVVTQAVKLLGVISSRNPWVVIIGATVALVTLIVTHWNEITAAVGAAWDWLVARAGEVWGWIERNIVQHVSAAAQWVGARIQDILSFFGWLASLPGQVAAWFGSLKNWAIQRLGELVGWVRGFPGRILSALGNLGSLLVGAGKDLVRGLINGIGNMAQAVWDKLVSIVQNAWNGVLDFLGIASPAKEGVWAGRMIGEGLVSGLDSMSRVVEGAALRLSDAAMVPTTTPDIGGVDQAVRHHSGPSGPAAHDGAALDPRLLRDALEGLSFVLDESGGRVLARVVNRENRSNARR